MSESLDKILDLLGIDDEKVMKEHIREEMVIVKNKIKN